MKHVFTGILLASSLLISCKSTKNKGLTKSMETIVVNAFTHPMNIYRATSPRLWNIVHTRVALSFDYKNRTAYGQEWLSLQPYFYPSDTLRLDAKSMKIESVTIGQSDKPLQYTYDSTSLLIKLDKTYTKDDLVRLSIKYTAMPYASASGGSAAIKDDRGLYFINHDGKIKGKPVQIWTQGETEANSHWLPTIDKPNSRTTVQMELTVPRQYKTLGNGELISSMDNGITRTDIWKMDKPIQVYAIMFAIGDFAIAKDSWRNKEVNYYVEPAYAPYARKMFQYTPEMMEFFSNATGIPYPWNKYSQVVVRDYVSGAMENTSASLFGEFMNQNHREYDDANHEDVVSHELFHQWFGDYVTAESWSHLTVNESFATYGEYLWRRHKYGLSYADELAWSDLQKYLDFTDYSDPILVRHHYRDKEDMFDRVSYQKGGAILHYLHHLMGDAAFYTAMNIYLSKNALQAAEATQWRLAVEEATGKDWNWFFDQWYHRAGHPVLDIKYVYDDAAQKLNVTLSQIQKEKVGLYELPLKALLIKGTEQTEITWNINNQKETYSYEYKNGVRPVIVPDVAHVLPGIIKENKTIKEWATQMNTCSDFVSQLLCIQNIGTKDWNSPEAQTILNKGFANKSAALRQAALEKIAPIETESLRSKYKTHVIMLATIDGNNAVKAAALSILGDWKIKEQKELLLQSIKDSSYLVAGNALAALQQIDDNLAYILAKEHVNEKPNTELDENAWMVLALKAKDEDTLAFKNIALNKNDAEKRNHIAGNLLLFALSTKSESAFTMCLHLLAGKIQETESKNYRTYYAGFLFKIKENIKLRLSKSSKSPLLLREMELLKAKAKALLATEKEEEVQAIYQKVMQ
jgi:aminopeptidase N